MVTVELLDGIERGFLKDFIAYMAKEVELQQVKRVIVRAEFVTDYELLNGLRLAEVLKKRYGMRQIAKGIGVGALDVYEIPIDRLMRTLRK